jgi:hypothetical protein
MIKHTNNSNNRLPLTGIAFIVGPSIVDGGGGGRRKDRALEKSSQAKKKRRAEAKDKISGVTGYGTVTGSWIGMG